MKPKNTNISTIAKTQTKSTEENDHRRKTIQLWGVRVAAVFLIIVFLASECAALLPVE